jgi:hypothetical protein
MKKLFYLLLIVLLFTSIEKIHAQYAGCTAQNCDVNYNPQYGGSTNSGTTTGSPSTPTTSPSTGNTQTSNDTTTGSSTNTSGSVQNGVFVPGGTNNTGPQARCSSVNNPGEYRQCCTDNLGTSGACIAYLASPLPAYYCQRDPSTCINDTPPINAGMGQQSTNPINNGGVSNDNTATGPVASSVDLSACSAIRFTSLLDILIWVKCIIVSALIPLIFVLAFFFFLIGILRFMNAGDNSARKEAAKNYIVWGMIGLFVMVGVWGIIKILGRTLGMDQPTVPLLQTEYLDQNRATKKR